LKVLFITYYWPPAGGVSPQRILHFVKNLSLMGVDCHVIHPENASYYQIDDSLSSIIPDGVTLHPLPIKDITRLVKRVPKMGAEGNIKSESKGLMSGVSKWLRANLFIPDPKVNWVNPVTKFALELHADHQYDLLFTNGTPHSVHLAGMSIKKRTQIPWIADFRDPWTKIDYFEKMPLTSRSLKRHQQLESSVVRTADVCLTVSPSWKNDFENLESNRACYIPNGFDQMIEREDHADFLIGHIGSLHGDRSLDDLLVAFNKLVDQEKSSEPKSKLLFVGNIDGSTLQKLRSQVPSDRLEMKGIVSHQEAKRWIAKSSMLVLPINQSQDAQGRIPAKLFEYLSSQIPIVVLGSCNGDAAKIVHQTKAGKCFQENDQQGLFEYLSEIKGKKTESYDLTNNIQAYSRENTANHWDGLCGAAFGIGVQ